MTESVTLTMSIQKDPQTVYAFVADPANLPRWAPAFCRSIDLVNGEWIMQTVSGPAKVLMSDRNAFGILDHFVRLDSGVEVYVPMRVVANGAGSEVIFTLFRQPAMTDEAFREDQRLVEYDLRTLKRLMEQSS